MFRFLKKKPANDVSNRIEELTRALPPDTDLARVEGPEDGACVCGDWVGAVVSSSGGSLAFPSLGQAMADGLFHVACRHSLAPYDPVRDEAKATLCTQLAVDAMERRRRDEQDAPGIEGSDAESSKSEFEHTYAAARRADAKGLHARALTLCRAALKMLQHEDLFGEGQDTVEQALRARIRTIESKR